jgi:hypothetical protein
VPALDHHVPLMPRMGTIGRPSNLALCE